MACCAFTLLFGLVAGRAHLHESTGHHGGPRGLHLDHRHLSNAAGHEHDHFAVPHGTHERDDMAAGHGPVDAHHVDGHGDDIVYLTVVVSVQPRVQATPAIEPIEAAIAPPPSRSTRLHAATRATPRGPPRKIPPRLRAPPA